MKYAVLGTGMVGHALATALVKAGHAVCMGSRTADNPKATAWASENGGTCGTFSDAAAFAEVVICATNGQHTLAALEAAGKDAIGSKIVIDISNPLDFSNGFPPSLFTGTSDSLGERIQAAYPDARVVKTLNTVNCDLMVDPGMLPGDHVMFVCGNDADAKAQVTALLTDGFGWRSVIDLGDITNARGTEAWLMLWVRLWKSLGHSNFNISLTIGDS